MLGDEPIQAGPRVAEQLWVVRKRWPDPTPAELTSILGKFPDAGRFERIVSFGDRPTSSAALVATSLEPLFVKRLNSRLRPASTTRIEHGFVDHLRSAGLAVPRYLRASDGDTVVVEGEWSYEVTTVAHGQDRYRGVQTWSPPSTDDAFGVGVALARLHDAAEGFDAPVRDHVPKFRLFWPLSSQLEENDLGFGARWKRWLAERPATSRYLAARGVEPNVAFEAHLRALARAAPVLAGLPALWTHNDWHVSNLFWQDHMVSETIDFGLSNRTCAIYDVAIAVERNAILWLEILAGDDTAIRCDVADGILSGYESMRLLSDRERRALPELLPIVQAEFALSALEEQVAGGRTDLANWSFDVFFQAHTRWFDTVAGTAMLGKLRKRWDNPAGGR